MNACRDLDATCCHLCLHRLIGVGANVNKRHELGWTPLHVAAVNRKPK